MIVGPIGQMMKNNFPPYTKDYYSDDQVCELNNREKKKTVVIVESNIHLREFLFWFLSLNYDCYMAANGTEGWVLIDRIMPDLVISEVLMLPMDGYELCEKIRTSHKTCHIPIILLITQHSPEHIVAGYEKGADACLTIPFKMTILKAEIEQLIKNRELIRESCEGRNSIREIISSTPTSDDKFIVKIRQLLEDSIVDPDFQISNLSSGLNMSYKNLYRKIKTLTGLSPIELVMSFKMQRAYHLLSNSGSVKEIGIGLGFQNLSYFSKCFKKQFGVTPMVVRQNGTQESTA